MFPSCWVSYFTCLVLLCTFLKYQGASITHGRCICPGVNGTYNLTSLQSTDDKPRFHTGREKWGYIYYYNPCSSFVKLDSSGDKGLCINDAAVCTGGEDGGPYDKLGDQSTASCGEDPDTGRPELVYKTANYGGEQYHVRVILTCDWSKESPDFEHINRKGLRWVFLLTHRCACPNGCPADPSPTTKTTAPPSKATGKTSSSTTGTTGFSAGSMYTFVPPIHGFPYESLTPLGILLVALGIVTSVILAVLLICFCLTRWRHNEDNGIRQHLLANAQNAVEVTENTFPKSNDGGRIGNLLNVSQSLPVNSPKSDCNITVSKKDDFNKIKIACGPV
ncbi:uncharacterized protein [Montipora capricornis]